MHRDLRAINVFNIFPIGFYEPHANDKAHRYNSTYLYSI